MDSSLTDDGWQNRASALLRIAETPYHAGDIELSCQKLAEAVRGALNCDTCVLHLVSADMNSLVRYVFAGVGGYTDPLADEMPLDFGRLGDMIQTREPIVMDFDHPHKADRISESLVDQNYKAAVSAPIMHDGTILGIYSVLYKRPLASPAENSGFLEMIGRALGASIARMRSAQKATELMLLKDRKLLGSEIHDNVSHLIGALSLQAASIMASYENDDMRSVYKKLQKFESTCGDTMRVLRDEMLSLRVPLESTDGWIQSVTTILEHFQEEWGIETTLTQDLRSASLPMNITAAMQLTRILNECLSNTLRHAHASRIDVGIYEGGGVLRMSVSDDGTGFDLAEVPSDRLGIKIMRERATAAGGELSIRSDDGGTLVIVELPYREKV